MAIPDSRDFTGIDGVSQWPAATANAIMDWVSRIYGGLRSMKGLILDSIGGKLDANFVRTAESPLFLCRDSAKNNRFIVDMYGYNRGRFNDYREDWLAIGGSTVTGAASVTAGRLNYSIPAGASLLFTSSANLAGCNALDIRHFNVASGSTSRLYPCAPVIGVQSFASAIIEFDVAVVSQSQNDVKIGFTDSGSILTGSASTARNDIALFRGASDTHWQLLTNIAGAGAVNKIDTGVTPSATGDRILLEFHGASSLYGAPTARLKINDVLVATTTTNVPFGGATAMAQVAAAVTSTNNTCGVDVLISPMHGISNRWLAGSLS